VLVGTSKPFTMPSTGRLSTVLAQYEETIEQNSVAGVASGMFLTKSASTRKLTSTKSKNHHNNNLNSTSTHSLKRTGNKQSSRHSRASNGGSRGCKEASCIKSKSEHKMSDRAKDWNTTSFLQDDSSSVSEMSQDSFGCDEAAPIDDPFQNTDGNIKEFNPFGLVDIPQCSDKSRKQRPLKEKRGVGRLGNRTTKTKLVVKAAKKTNGKDKKPDNNEGEGQCKNYDDKDIDIVVKDEDDNSGKIIVQSNHVPKGHDTKLSLVCSSIGDQQRDNITRRSKTDLDRSSTHSFKTKQDRQHHLSLQTYSAKKGSIQNSECARKDGLPVTYVAKGDDGVQGCSSDDRKCSKDLDRTSRHGRSVIRDRDRRAIRNTSPADGLEASSHKMSNCLDVGKSPTTHNESSSRHRKCKIGNESLNDHHNHTNHSRNGKDVMELNSSEPLSPTELVKKDRDKATPTSIVHPHSPTIIESGTNTDLASRRVQETPFEHKSQSAHVRSSGRRTNHNNHHHHHRNFQNTSSHKSTHVERYSNTMDPSSAQSRFFGVGQSSVMTRAKLLNTTGSKVPECYHGDTNNPSVE
jgi:hypothetical protein